MVANQYRTTALYLLNSNMVLSPWVSCPLFGNGLGPFSYPLYKLSRQVCECYSACPLVTPVVVVAQANETYATARSVLVYLLHLPAHEALCISASGIPGIDPRPELREICAPEEVPETFGIAKRLHGLMRRCMGTRVSKVSRAGGMSTTAGSISQSHLPKRMAHPSSVLSP